MPVYSVYKYSRPWYSKSGYIYGSDVFEYSTEIEVKLLGIFNSKEDIKNCESLKKTLIEEIKKELPCDKNPDSATLDEFFGVLRKDMYEEYISKYPDTYLLSDISDLDAFISTVYVVESEINTILDTKIYEDEEHYCLDAYKYAKKYRLDKIYDLFHT
jgi:hypothetical protein